MVTNAKKGNCNHREGRIKGLQVAPYEEMDGHKRQKRAIVTITRVTGSDHNDS